jgi:hypothetical protein
MEFHQSAVVGRVTMQWGTCKPVIHTDEAQARNNVSSYTRHKRRTFRWGFL